MKISKRFITVFVFALAFVAFVFLEFKGIIWHNHIFARQYPIEGLDVSNHQGIIDWEKVASSNNYKFVYIKATEGHDFTDDYFLSNWESAKKNGLLVGAYHFFSTRSSGKQQAEFFIRFVPKEDASLPPVVDIEIDLNKNPDQIRQELTDLLNNLEQHYQKRPILYVRYDTYNTYIKGHFNPYFLWVRDIFKYPTFGREWLFWQYSERGRVDGIQSYVDINVFQGTQEDLLNLTKVQNQ